MNPRTHKTLFHGFLAVLALLEYRSAVPMWRKHCCAAWGGFHLSAALEHYMGDPE